MWELSLKLVNSNEYSLSAQTLANHLRRLSVSYSSCMAARSAFFFTRNGRFEMSRSCGMCETFVTWAPVPSAGRKFSYFGYEFDSPWTELMRERKMESVAILNFSTGGFIEVLAPSKNENELDAMKHEAEKRGVDIRNVFGMKPHTPTMRFALRYSL